MTKAWPPIGKDRRPDKAYGWFETWAKPLFGRKSSPRITVRHDDSRRLPFYEPLKWVDADWRLEFPIERTFGPILDPEAVSADAHPRPTDGPVKPARRGRRSSDPTF